MTAKNDDDDNKPNVETGTTRAPTNDRNVDAGWAWVILTATCVMNTFNGLVYVTGIFNVMFLERFQQSRQVTAWVGAVQTSSLCLYGEWAVVCAVL